MNKNSYYFFKWDIYNLIGMSDESVILLYNIEKREWKDGEIIQK